MRFMLITLIVCSFSAVPATGGQNQPKKQPSFAALRATPEQFLKFFDKNNDNSVAESELPKYLARLFAQADQNRDRQLNLAEIRRLQQLLRQRFNQNNPQVLKQRVDRAVKRALALDENGDRKISRREAKENLARAFARINTDKNDYLDEKEIRTFFTRVFRNNPTGPNRGGGVRRPQGPPDFDAFDANADGRLTLAELANTQFLSQFNQMDVDQSGQLTKREFEAYLDRLSKKD